MSECHVTKRGSLDGKLGAAAWGLFFIWTGFAFLADIGWGAGLLGAGIITLGAQAARKHFALRLEGFWVVAGALFALGGIWELFRVEIGFMPVLCIAAGLALLASIFFRRAGNSGLRGQC